VDSINSFPTEPLIGKKNLADEHCIILLNQRRNKRVVHFPKILEKQKQKQKNNKNRKKLDASASWRDNTAAQEARWWRETSDVLPGRLGHAHVP